MLRSSTTTMSISRLHRPGQGQDSPLRLMGSAIASTRTTTSGQHHEGVADKLLSRLKGVDPLLEIAKRLEDVALSDPYS